MLRKNEKVDINIYYGYWGIYFYLKFNEIIFFFFVLGMILRWYYKEKGFLYILNVLLVFSCGFYLIYECFIINLN